MLLKVMYVLSVSSSRVQLVLPYVFLSFIDALRLSLFKIILPLFKIGTKVP